MLPTEKLRSRGCLVLCGVLGEDATNALRIIARRAHLPWAAEDPTSPRLRRDIAMVPSTPAMLLSIILQHYYRIFFPTIQPSMLLWNYLKSYGGSPDQPIHRNFVLPTLCLNPMDSEALPGSLLLATQDDTVIYGFGWNHQVAFQSEKLIIKLRKGDMVIFRGDFIHARAGYHWNNLCVHTYLTPTHEHRLFTGQLIPLYADKPRANPACCRCYVWGCRYEGPTKPALSKHLSSRYNFMTRSSPSNGEYADDEPGRVHQNRIPFHSSLAITVMIRLTNAGGEFGEDEDPSRLLDSTPEVPDVDDDLEMEILIATDSDSDT